MNVTVAIDLGGTYAKGAIVGDDGRVLATDRIETPRSQGPDVVIARLGDFAANLIVRAETDGTRADAVGISVPGVVDERRGIAVFSANLGWRDLPLAGLLSARVGRPVTLSHDVRAGGLAEAVYGAGRGVDVALVLPIGTGIAGALIQHGVAFTGAHGGAVELGHVPIAGDQTPCGCGAVGCVERIASASAIAIRYEQRTGRPASAKEVAELAASGQEPAQAVWNEAIAALASMLTIATTVLDPARIVIGGGLSLAGDRLMTPLRAAFQSALSFQTEPELVVAELGDQAGVVGAALAARRAITIAQE